MFSEISKVTRLQMGITQNMSLFFKKVHYVTATCAEKCIIREAKSNVFFFCLCVLCLSFVSKRVPAVLVFR